MLGVEGLGRARGDGGRRSGAGPGAQAASHDLSHRAVPDQLALASNTQAMGLSGTVRRRWPGSRTRPSAPTA